MMTQSRKWAGRGQNLGRASSVVERFEWIEANVKKHDRICDHLAERENLRQ